MGAHDDRVRGRTQTDYVLGMSLLKFFTVLKWCQVVMLSITWHHLMHLLCVT